MTNLLFFSLPLGYLPCSIVLFYDVVNPALPMAIEEEKADEVLAAIISSVFPPLRISSKVSFLSSKVLFSGLMVYAVEPEIPLLLLDGIILEFSECFDLEWLLAFKGDL
jgi:hypothetical protein